MDVLLVWTASSKRGQEVESFQIAMLSPQSRSQILHPALCGASFR